jgi:hypothetical protein
MSSTECERYLAILRQHDDGAGWEAPSSFDHAAAEQQFRALVAAVEHAVETPLRAESGRQIQDASFLGQISLACTPLVKDPTMPGPVILRVSNWGEMATVSDEEALTADGLAQIKDLLAQRGYVYVPPQILALPYDGKLPTKGAVSWWLRFFDWL